MNTYPANEQKISDVERGRSCEAVLPSSPAEPPCVGDTILFAHSQSRGGQQPSYIKGGDSVLVSLTDVADLNETDPATGLSLYRVRWTPLGQPLPIDAPKRVVRAHGSHKRT
jgi:hypothetical protein